MTSTSTLTLRPALRGLGLALALGASLLLGAAPAQAAPLADCVVGFQVTGTCALPAGVTSFRAQVFGGGGGGAPSQARPGGSNGAGGGGGGSLCFASWNNLPVGTVIETTLGSGGAMSGDGGWSGISIRDASNAHLDSIAANGGKGSASATGGAGGTIASCMPGVGNLQMRYAGGNGGNAALLDGGGGGAAPGPNNANGNSANGITGATGWTTQGTRYGYGGDGGATGSGGSDGLFPGGGGGGAGGEDNGFGVGGAGGAGAVYISFDSPVDGACGTPAAQATAPTSGLCTTGSPSAVSSANGAYTWQCQGLNGGTTDNTCQAPWASAGGGKGSVLLPSGANPNNWQVDSASFSANPPAPAPQGVTFPAGVLTLNLTSGTANTDATVTLNFTSRVPSNAVYMKYGPSPDGYNCQGAACAQPHWYTLPASRVVLAPDGLSATLTLTDNGLGDSDTTNSQITDPGGFAVLAAAGGNVQAIPTLNEWGLILLSVLAAAVGLHAKRRRA